MVCNASCLGRLERIVSVDARFNNTFLIGVAVLDRGRYWALELPHFLRGLRQMRLVRPASRLDDSLEVNAVLEALLEHLVSRNEFVWSHLTLPIVDSIVTIF